MTAPPTRGVAHGERGRLPAEHAPKAGDAGCAGIVGEHDTGSTRGGDAAVGDDHGAVGEGRGAFEPVLGEQHRGAEVGVEARERAEHVVGALGIELRRGLVEHERRRRRRERAGDDAPLLLASGKGGRVAVAEVNDAERIERLLDPPPHRFGREPEVLEHEREVALHVVDDELRFRILGDEADDVGELARMVRSR